MYAQTSQLEEVSDSYKDPSFVTEQISKAQKINEKEWGDKSNDDTKLVIVRENSVERYGNT